MFKRKEKNPEAVGVKEVFGVTTLSSMNAVATIFMSTMFMIFMTDYAGLGAMGASLATTLLLVARIFDAVDDPIQGFIMDNGKVGKHGKYKPFFLISIICTCVGPIMLYLLPDGLTKNPIMVTIWVIFFYLVYDIGTSFNNGNLLYRTMTNDPAQRSKLVIGPRMLTLMLGMFGAFITAIAVGVQESVGSYKTAYFLITTVACVGAFLLSLLGWFMVKEKHVVQQEAGEKVKFSDFLDVLKNNKAMVVQFLKNLFAGFIWTLLFATPSYYLKWGYCANLTTGETNMELLGVLSMVSSLMMLFPMMIGPFIATPLLKACRNSPIRLARVLLLVQAACGLSLFVLQILGILQTSPVIFFVIMFIMTTAIGADFVPQSTISMEIMDYTIYKTGKDRAALTGVLDKFLEKAQSALSSALIGGVLIAIGYNVDSVTGDYVGELSKLPAMLNWFIVIMGLLPCILAICAWFVYKKYPINDEIRADMRAFIDAKNVKEEAK